VIPRRSILLVLVCLGGCAGTLEDPDRFAPNASSGGSAPGCPDVPALFTTSCAAGSGCHSTQDKVKDLDLQSPALADRLREVKASSGALLVDPAKPAESVLYTKLTATPPFGARMPYGGSALDDTTLKCVLTWVSQPK
jgi:hypothetical protein